MAQTLLVAGTASHVGKSTIAAGLCRYLAKQGVSVAPFKAQNMSNNARVAITPDGEWGEIGVSQYVQARAARVAASTDMNPVLLKPRGDGESQLIIDGRAVADVSTSDYYSELWERARAAAEASYERLSAAHDVVIAEGAGSISEINLHDRDLANIETAAFADADILLVTDIDRGGAFASLVGTVELLPDSVRDRLVGIAITKFRGDRSLLTSGIETIERRTGIPVLGVLPYSDPGLPAEDSVSLPAADQSTKWGTDDNVAASESVTIAVPTLPRISNFTDLEPLAGEPGVRVAFQPLDAGLDSADAVVLPGSKNTVDDLLALKNAGFDEALAAFSGPVVGLCGGYQMLGERITNAAIEGTGDQESLEGFGLLPVETRFSSEKHVERVTRSIRGVGPLGGASGTVEGYEIHMGDVTITGDVERPFATEGAVKRGVLGTFLHGLFENENARSAFIETIYAHTSQSRPADSGDAKSSYAEAAELIEAHLSLGPLNLT